MEFEKPEFDHTMITIQEGKGDVDARAEGSVPINSSTYLYRCCSPLGTLNNNYCCWLGLGVIELFQCEFIKVGQAIQ